METRWRDRQIEAAREITNQASQALRQGQLEIAERAFEEATVILDMVEETVDEELMLRAQLCNELGFVRHRQERLDEARTLHEEAVELCENLLEKGVEFRGNTAATHINLAGILAQMDDLKAAKEVNTRAVELAEQMLGEDGAPPQTVNLAFGAHQNLAVIAARDKDLQLADSEMESAIGVLKSASEEGQQQAAAQVAQGAQQLSVLMFQEQEFDRALRWGTVAEEYSEMAYQVHGEPVLPVYVTSQINLISFHEKTQAFAAAEDALFKALEIVGDNVQILERGKMFYETCRKMADNVLEAGNLPRAEVEESYKEISERLEVAQAAEAQEG